MSPTSLRKTIDVKNRFLSTLLIFSGRHFKLTLFRCHSKTLLPSLSLTHTRTLSLTLSFYLVSLKQTFSILLLSYYLSLSLSALIDNIFSCSLTLSLLNTHTLQSLSLTHSFSRAFHQIRPPLTNGIKFKREVVQVKVTNFIFIENPYPTI